LYISLIMLIYHVVENIDTVIFINIFDIIVNILYNYIRLILYVISKDLQKMY